MQILETTFDAAQETPNAEASTVKEHEIVRELNALELCLVGGGSGAAAFW